MTNNGGPAFPAHMKSNDGGDLVCDCFAGMTLRDYFAAQAMNAIMQAYMVLTMKIISQGGDLPDIDDGRIARESYESADAMLKERAREEKD